MQLSEDFDKQSDLCTEEHEVKQETKEHTAGSILYI